MDTELTKATLHIGGLDLATGKPEIVLAFKNHVRFLEFIAIYSRSGGLNCAHVHFSTHEAAEMACKEVNGALIHGRSVTVDVLNPKYNVFIKNFPENVTDRDLEGEFASCGRILSVKVPSDQPGHSRGYGFIQFASAEATAQALAKTGQLWRGDRLKVEPFRSFEERQFLTNLLVFGFHNETTKYEFDALFGQFGEIEASQIQQNRVDGKLKSLGFVTYKELTSAETAVNALNQREALRGRLTVQIPTNPSALPQAYKSKKERKNDRWKLTNLMFTLLPPSVTENQLLQMCEVHGRVTSIRMPYKSVEESKKGTVIHKTVPTGAAFVNFQDPESAGRARIALDGRKIQHFPICVKYWRPRSDFQQYSWTQAWKHGAFDQFFDYPRPTRKRIPGPTVSVRPATASLTVSKATLPVQPQASSLPASQLPVTQPVAAPSTAPAPSVSEPKSVSAAPAAKEKKKSKAAPKQPVTTRWVKRKPDQSTELRSQKQALGEALYPQVAGLTDPHVAGSVLDTLLDRSIPELIQLTENSVLLRRSVSETLEVLRTAWSADEKKQRSLDLLKLKDA